MGENFNLQKTSGKARAGILKTRAGDIQTPFFMSVATRAAIKAGVSMEDLDDVQAPVVLANTYHLHLKPGESVVAQMGGLHDFMKCDKPILTDSGGYQVFSIKRKKITDTGVWFNSHIDGKRIFIDAKRSIEIQHALGADMIMAFDECPPSRLPNFNPDGDLKKQERNLYFKVRKAVERTTEWAKISLDVHQKKYPLNLPATKRPQIFGIVQGGTFPDLREKSLAEITALPFDGFAMGGLAVGEPPEAMYKVLDEIAHKLPKPKPRYLMGVGSPIDLIEAVSRGIDMFDCVYPSRNARHGTVYTWNGQVRISNEKYALDKNPMAPNCGCPACVGGYSRGYIHHLIKVGEALGSRLVTLHNLYFYHDLMRTMREKILEGSFEKWKIEAVKRLKQKN